MDLDPPNKAAVYYNLSVAWLNMDEKTRSAGYIIKSIYTDPSLPEDEFFYQNPEVLTHLGEIIKLFTVVEENSVVMKPAKTSATETFTPSPSTAKYAQYRLKFEGAIKANKAEAIKLLFAFTRKAPEFFASEDCMTSKQIMSLIASAKEKFKSSGDPNVAKFATFLTQVIANYKSYSAGDQSGLSDETRKIEAIIASNPREAVFKLFTLNQKRPDMLDSPDLFKSVKIGKFISLMANKYSSTENPKAKKYAVFLNAVLDKKELAEQYWDFINEAEMALGMGDQRQASFFVAQAITTIPAVVSKKDFYNLSDIVAMSREIYKKFGTIKMNKIRTASESTPAAIPA
jgi:hypothetical protein